MLPIYICEDNSDHREKIAIHVENYILMENLDMEIALQTDDPHMLIKCISENKVRGLYFLDVDLRTDLNGIELADTIRKYDPRGFIVFISAYPEMLEFTLKYKVEPMDYIVKDNILGIGKKISECIENANKKHTTTAYQDAYRFKTPDNRIISLDYSYILFFESSPLSTRKTIVHSKTGSYEFYAKLSDIEKQLDGNFMRCHKSYIVNLKNVEQIDKNKKIVYMKGGSECYASTRLIKALADLLLHLA